ncbi:MAG: YgjV family protein [Treponema sp.]|jgi:hypothetical protein|nr:YgjV family protein [Treponema sp.]
MIEILGYLASVFIAISITIKGGLSFRILNMTGSVCFFIYAFFIGSIPVAIINIYGAGINMFYITKEIKKLKNS